MTLHTQVAARRRASLPIRLGGLVVLAFAVCAVALPAPASAGIDATISQWNPIGAGGPTWSTEWNKSSTTYSPTDNSMGQFRWESLKYDGPITVYFTAYFSVSNNLAGSGTVGLFASGNTTTPVASVTNAAGSGSQFRYSAAITLTNNATYTVRTRVANAAYTLDLYEANILVVQHSDWPTPITKTSTQIEIGDDFTTTSTAYVPPTDTRFWTLPNVPLKYDASPKCYFEASMTGTGAGSTSVALVGSAAPASPLTSVSTTATAWTRIRSSAFGCTTEQEVHAELRSSAATRTARMQNAKIIIEQSGPALSKLQTYLPLQTHSRAGLNTEFSDYARLGWNPALYEATPSSDLKRVFPYSGVTAKVNTPASASAQVCSYNGSGCETTPSTPLSGSLQGNLSSSVLKWYKSQLITNMSFDSFGDLAPQFKAPSTGSVTTTQSYLPLDLTFFGSLRIVSAPTTTNLPDVQLDGTAQATTGPLGAVQVKDNRPAAPGWTLTASSTDFSGGLDSIASSQASIITNPVTTPNGSVLTGVSSGAGGSLDQSRVLATAAPGSGLGTYSENPDEQVEIDTTKRGGTYTAVLTITLS